LVRRHSSSFYFHFHQVGLRNAGQHKSFDSTTGAS